MRRKFYKYAAAYQYMNDFPRVSKALELSVIGFSASKIKTRYRRYFWLSKFKDCTVLGL